MEITSLEVNMPRLRTFHLGNDQQRPEAGTSIFACKIQGMESLRFFLRIICLGGGDCE
jgi:hypothetical protein